MPGWVWVETDHPAAPIFDIIIRHQCTGVPRDRPWYLEERRILVGEIKAGEETDIKVVMITPGSGVPADTMRAVTTESEAVQVSLGHVQRTSEAVEGEVTVAASPSFRGPFSAEVTVHGTGSGMTLILIGRVVD